MDSPSLEAEDSALVDILIGIDIPSSLTQSATGSLNPRLEDNVVGDVEMLGPVGTSDLEINMSMDAGPSSHGKYREPYSRPTWVNKMLNKAARARQITRLTHSLNHSE